ncbi:MAG: ATP-grasp domain-containing protein, partial [Eubacteriales bacterium]
DWFWEMPRLSDLSIDEFICYCKDNNVSCIVPSRDGELAFFAKHKKTLHNSGIQVMVSDYKVTQTCLDKVTFSEKVSVMGFPAIPTVINIDNLNCDSYVVKERYGTGSLNIGLGLTREEAVAHAGKLAEPIFQPMVEGREVSVDLYVDSRGMTKGVVARGRDWVVNGESQVTTTIRDLKLEKLCSDFAQKMKLYGHVVMQVIIDDRDEFHIIECNTRFGGASTLSLEVGLDSFYWFLLESSGVDISSYPFARLNADKKQVRYAEDFILS